MNYWKRSAMAKKIIILLCGYLMMALPAQADEDLAGKVLETMNSGGYTYALLETNGEKKWVALPLTKMAAGDLIVVSPGVEMGAYTSPTLARTFESIIFSSGLKDIKRKVSEQEESGAGEDEPALVVEKATGPEAFTIEELYAQKASLADKPVAVRGKVVKVSKFQGKHWLRLKDGSGSRRRGDHKLLVTSEQGAEKDDIVTAKGVLKADLSIGGLIYEVLVEDARLEK